MRSLRLPLILVVFVSFGLGIGWSLKLRRDREAAEGHWQPQANLRILTLPDLLPKDLIQRFERQQQIQLILTLANDSHGLLERLKKERFDAVFLFSHQLDQGFQQGLLRTIDRPALKGGETLSADFRRLPNSHTLEQTVPLLWGLIGFAVNTKVLNDPPKTWGELLNQNAHRPKFLKFTSELERLAKLSPKASVTNLSTLSASSSPLKQTLEASNAPAVVMLHHGQSAFAPFNVEPWQFILPEDKASLWVLSLTMAAQTENEAGVHLFADFLLERESTLALVKHTEQAATSRWIEESDLDRRLKPSYIRQVPLTAIEPMQVTTGP